MTTFPGSPDGSATEREENECEAKLALLRSAISLGDSSGLAEGDVFARVKERLGLPAEP
jgi:hypothetical protein